MSKTRKKPANQADVREEAMTSLRTFESRRRHVRYAPYAPLKNLGNTCYMNSIIQALFFCAPFRDGVFALEERIHTCDLQGREDLKNVAFALAKLYRDMRDDHIRRVNKEVQLAELNLAPKELISRRGREKSVNPLPFATAVGVANSMFANLNRQHDVQEFLRCLLGNLLELEHALAEAETPADLEDELVIIPLASRRTKRKVAQLTSVPAKQRRTSKSATSVRQAVRGSSPKRERKRENAKEREKEVDLDATESKDAQSTPLVERLFQGDCVSSIQCLRCDNLSSHLEPFLDLSLNINQGRSLHWSLSQYVALERLSGANSYHCANCNKFTDATQRLRFHSLPPVLTIHLKRFTFENMTKRKVPFHVAAPLQLQFEGVDDNPRFELLAAVLHKGSYSSCGHYVTCVRVPRDPATNPHMDGGVLPPHSAPSSSSARTPRAKNDSSSDGDDLIIDVEAFSADELIIDFRSDSFENDEDTLKKDYKNRALKPKIIAESVEYEEEDEEEELELDDFASSDDEDDDDFFCDDSSDEEMKLRLSEAIAHKIVNHVRNSNAMEMQVEIEEVVVSESDMERVVVTPEHSIEDLRQRFLWLRCDDESVSYLTEPELTSLTGETREHGRPLLDPAYVLFYVRSDIA